MGDRIHIALSPWDLSDLYNRHAGTTLVSILENCSEPITVHILYDEQITLNNSKEADDNVSKYIQLGKKYQAEIVFHKIDLPEWVNDNNRKNLMHFTPGSLLRLYLPEVLPDLDKIIYFDCDMVILMDVSDLWGMSIDGYSLGAVLDGGCDASLYYYTGKKNKIGLNIRKYFNTGLLVMNLARIRSSGIFSTKIMKIISEHPEYLYPDQDALNMLFQETETLLLPQRYNIPVGLRMTNFRLKKELGIVGDQYSDCILHFCGTKKPWNIYSGSVDKYYWDYLLKTPWGENHAVVDKMYNEAKDRKKTLLDKIMSTPLNRYFKLAESIIKKY